MNCHKRLKSCHTEALALSEIVDKGKDKKTSVRFLNEVISKYNDTKKLILGSQEQKKALEKELKDIMPDICPICGSHIHKD